MTPDPAATLMSHIDALASEIGPRGSTTAGERRGAAYCRTVFNRLGLNPVLETYSAARSIFFPHLLASILYLACFAIYPLGGRATAWAAALIAALTLASELLELGFKNNPLRLLGPVGQSQNVHAVVPPAGEEVVCTTPWTTMEPFVVQDLAKIGIQVKPLYAAVFSSQDDRALAASRPPIFHACLDALDFYAPIFTHEVEHVGGFAELAPGEGGVGHLLHQVVHRLHLGKVERIHRLQVVGDRVVQLALDAGAFARGRGALLRLAGLGLFAVGVLGLQTFTSGQWFGGT